MSGINKKKIVISIVSHNQSKLVFRLLSDLDKNGGQVFDVVVTYNTPESSIFQNGSTINIQEIYNKTPKGFAENHNAAFLQCRGDYFAVVNPDIRIESIDFRKMVDHFSAPKVALVAPKIISPTGQVEDSARRFPTLRSLLSKAVGSSNGTYPELNSSPDWVGGMFMLFRSDVFREIGGFDENFFLYYEDVDICWRLRQKGYEIKFVPSVEVIHDARRESRKNWRYARWHLASMARYLIKAKAWW